MVWEYKIQFVKFGFIVVVEIYLLVCCFDDRYLYIQLEVEKSGKCSVCCGLFILMYGELYVYVLCSVVYEVLKLYVMLKICLGWFLFVLECGIGVMQLVVYSF